MILPYNKTNKAGEKVQLWTHSSYLDQGQLQKLRQAQKSRMTYRNYLGLFGFIAGFKLAGLPAVSKIVPPKIPFIGVPAVIGLIGYFAGNLLFVAGKSVSDVNDLMQRTTLPLWKDKKNVLSIDRAFFHLDQTKHNQPNLLYHGLTAQNAAKIFPDQIVGPAPKAPHKAHDHGHGHGHSAHH